ncbi:formylglycine-generating enzyme family protein, partial [Sedimentisphaera salicampi]|uniref:formylglycine-generating enzyme family protein n=1 Tax=Sedimentisphaera salicampi TaxID=1941349 RepID=UPI000B9A326E
MKNVYLYLAALALIASAGLGAYSENFGSGDNQFTLSFVDISANPGVTSSTNTNGDTVETFTNGVVGDYTDPGYNYRMGTYEITNDQFSKFKAEYGTVTGDPSSAYDESPSYTGSSVPTNNVSWYEAAQFVNYLNTSKGHQAAYKFTGTQGESSYALSTWSEAEAAGGTNLYRHKDAQFFLPTEDEWVKAAYWNGSSIQTYATTDGSTPQDGVDSNYDDATQPWDVGSGTEELNGTFDMMGNVSEWMESPWNDVNYDADIFRGLRGGECNFNVSPLASSERFYYNPKAEDNLVGFRVASVPEPATMA